MIAAILIGRGGSVGLPNKNVLPLLNRPMMSYPLMAAQHCENVDEVFVSSDCDQILQVAKKLNAKIINRPARLATSDATVEDVFVHAYESIKKSQNDEIEFLVLLMCNAVAVLPELIDKGVAELRSDTSFHSAVSVSGFNMYSPIRARKIHNDGSLVPFVPFQNFAFKVDSNRQKQDTVYFHDCGVSVVRPCCLENIENGLLPQKWMGQKIYPLIQEGVLDVDYEYELSIAENWLKKAGYSERKVPYDLKCNDEST
jgi:CMP-N-acetylneuraminic acid synthetase